MVEAPPALVTARPSPVQDRGRSRPRIVPAVLVAMVAGAAVLRASHLSGTTFIWDETFTGAAARLPFGRLIHYLAGHDVHPPLDYLLRGPIARHTTSEWLLRLPSALASVGAVAVAASWLRRRGALALVTVGLLAVSAFQLNYAWQARPYAPMVLVGVTLAFLSHRWLQAGGVRLAVLAGLVLLVGCFESESALVLAAGLLLLPGLRRDRNAWWWRASLAGAVSLWLLGWGTVLADQRDNLVVTSGIPHTTLHGALSSLNELVDHMPALIPLTVFLVLVGGVCLARDDRPLARVWLCAFAMPFLFIAVAGLREHVLVPKALAVIAWGPLLALGAVVDAALRRWRPLGAAAVAVVALMVLPSTAHVMRVPQVAPPTWAAEVRALHRVARPGDTVVGPAWLERPVDWYFGLDARLASPAPHVHIDPYSFVIRPGPANGRVWLTESGGPYVAVQGMVPCGRAIPLPDGTRIVCMQRSR